MARIRTIKPEFPQSESVGRLSRDARLLFIQLWTIVDDSGRARGASRFLASTLYPYDEDAPALIEGWLSELEAEGMVRRYVAQDGNTYLDIPKWHGHQKIDRPSASKIPAFDEASRGLAKAREGSSLDLDLGPVPRTKDLGPGPRAASAACSEPDEPASEPEPDEADASPVVLEFECVGKGQRVYRLTEAKVAEYRASFPGVDVVAELRKSWQWLRDSPQRRKTASGMPRFLTNWLSRSQNSGTFARAGPVNGSHAALPPTESVPDKLRRLRGQEKS